MPMLNRDIFSKDLSSLRLVIAGVANVNEGASDAALAVLRYELETFVCDGQYSIGLQRLLETYLGGVDKPQQPAVWVSGFFGSGKSHLVKMLRALWVDAEFPDGMRARAIAALPPAIQDLLKELSNVARRHGGLHAAAGTLGSASSAQSVRLALLAIVFRSLGLPEQFHQAAFVLWLRSQGALERVRARIGEDRWHTELANMFVSPRLHDALVAEVPAAFASREACKAQLLAQFKRVDDVSREQMLDALRQALSVDGKLPLTLVVLDEVQQFIGDSTQRSLEVQEAVEDCCKGVGGRLLFVGTGQTAITGTSNLKKLEGRFTVRGELSDADVDAVVRRVLLAKQPAALAAIEAVYDRNRGEIARHLAGTSLAARPDDAAVFAQDYPLLPVRRRFWEESLRVLDRTGTDSQLRNQLGMVLSAVRAVLDAPLGAVVPTDFVYFHIADRLLQTQALPRALHERTNQWAAGGSDDEKLLARACGLIFLINRISAAREKSGLAATVDVLSDLLVEDLSAGSAALRARLPKLLDGCDLLLRIDDQYTIQTQESLAWINEFEKEKAALASQRHLLDSERVERLRERVKRELSGLQTVQGLSRTPRTAALHFDSAAPAGALEKPTVWVRDGWAVDESSAAADARAAGPQAALACVYVPRTAADALNAALVDLKAASATLQRRGAPGASAAADVHEAYAAMLSRRTAAEARIASVFEDALAGAKVFLAGGSAEITADKDLRTRTLAAVESAALRLFPEFTAADHPGWPAALRKAQNGDPNALAEVGHAAGADAHPVGKALLKCIGGGRKGADVRKQFEGPPYGWPGDAIDGALYALLVAGHAYAVGDDGARLDFRKLERKNLGKYTFRVESTVISKAQELQVRKLLQAFDLPSTGDLAAQAAAFVAQALALAQRAGGDAPRPAIPETSLLFELRGRSGNDLLGELFAQRESLTAAVDEWKRRAAAIEQRLPNWERLQRLLQLADAELADVAAQAHAIRDERRLLDEPDLVAPLLTTATNRLRERLDALAAAEQAQAQAGEEKLAASDAWRRTPPEQQEQLRERRRLRSPAADRPTLAGPDDVLAALTALPLRARHDAPAGLAARYDAALHEAALALQPQASAVEAPRRTIHNEAELDAWLADARARIAAALEKGPVIVK